MYNMKAGEDAEQIGVIEWANWSRGRYPELALLFHVPNGGKRSATEAARFKAMGVKAGVPDLFLPVPRGGYAGLFIEMKYGKNKTTDLQNEWLDNLKKQGYMTTICWGGREATAVLEKYLDQSKTILCDPQKAKPDKAIAVYARQETVPAIRSALQYAVQQHECVFSKADEEVICIAPEDPDQTKEEATRNCCQCIADNVEFNIYD